jgi:hypothetical protein
LGLHVLDDFVDTLLYFNDLGVIFGIGDEKRISVHQELNQPVVHRLIDRRGLVEVEAGLGCKGPGFSPVQLPQHVLDFFVIYNRLFVCCLV